MKLEWGGEDEEWPVPSFFVVLVFSVLLSGMTIAPIF
jgi:hypothetical protein